MHAAVQISTNTVRDRIDILVSEINSHTALVSSSLAELGTLLLTTKKDKLWEDWGFSSFPNYINSLTDKIEKGRTQLYHILGVAEKLLPYVDAKDIEEMGITKASVLAQASKTNPAALTNHLIENAKNPNTTIRDLRMAVLPKDESAENYHTFDFGCIYVTEDEKQEILRCFELAKRVGQPPAGDLTETQLRKHIMFKIIQEFLATYEATESAS